MPESETTNEPATNESGFAMLGDYPLNSRLRAEALAKAGVDADPDSIVSADLIASTVERLALEAVANAPAPVNARMTLDKLRTIAAAESVSIDPEATREDIVFAIEAARGAANQEG